MDVLPHTYFYFASEEETQAGVGCCLTSEPLPVLSSHLLVPFSTPPLPSAGGAHRPLSSVANHYFFKPWLQCLLYEASFDQPPPPRPSDKINDSRLSTLCDVHFLPLLDGSQCMLIHWLGCWFPPGEWRLLEAVLEHNAWHVVGSQQTTMHLRT